MSTNNEGNPNVGFVAIGRNEGDRLVSALSAIKKFCSYAPVVYVDSGSTDNSCAFARSIDIDVVELDLSIPFTAARARNAGAKALLSTHPNLEFIQFFDGDCEMVEGWIEAAISELQRDDKLAIVSGRRLEKFKEASIYNTLMDIEWDTPIGDTSAVLGDMCVKTEAFRSVSGFSENIIAAEDDDFCIRIRKAGYKVRRIDHDMSRHDANITRLSQWYRRSKRGGHGYANINHLHGDGPDKYFRKELKSVAFWGAAIPLLFVLLLLLKPLLALGVALVYCLFIFKTFLRLYLRKFPIKIAFAYATLIYTGKFYEFLGALQYWKNRILSRKHQLIEYK